MNKILVSILLLIVFLGKAQSPRLYAEQVIKKMTSQELAGRGYVDDGMQKAAKEIADQFEKIGLQKISGSYFQEFTYPVNIIKTSKVSVNNKELQLGKDYLVGAGSPTFKGEFSPLIFNYKVLDSLVEWDNRKGFDEEMNRINNQPIVFPNISFPENLTSFAQSANQLYREIPQLIANNEIEVKSPLVIQQTPSKLIHSLSSIQTKTVNLFINSQTVPEEINTVNVDINSSFEPRFPAKNVIGYIKGKKSDSIIVLTAHYDHLGKINDIIFPGANDNASGVAFILSMAKVFTKTPPEYDMVFIAFAGEEAGLQGSKYFVNNPLFDLKKIKFLLNFDMVGTGEEGIQVVNGKEYTKEFGILENISHSYNYLKQVKVRGAACNSDHCPFYEKGVPSFFVYTLGGKSGYHDIYDTEVSLFSFDRLVALFTKFINKL